MIKFLKKNLKNKGGWLAAFTFLGGCFLPLKTMAAAGSTAGQIAGWILGASADAIVTPIFFVMSSLTLIAGLVGLVVTYFVGIVLEMSLNGSIVNLPAVQAGFTVTLSVANLGFVAAIIFIAISTILRIETYAVKKTLWKLIVAALLVNFSLVFAGAIINISDQFSLFFLKDIPGAGGGFSSFGNSLYAAFNPYQYINPQDATDIATQATSGAGEQFAGFLSGLGEEFSAMVAPMAGIGMAMIGSWLMVIVLAVFLFMLVIRYVTLAILLILMPMAWLTWIFSGLSQHWSKWWSTFFRWTFFAPISLFFLWLVIATGTVIQANTSDNPFKSVPQKFSSSADNPVEQALANSFDPAFNPLIGTFLTGIFMIALTIGGLYAANKLSIMGAGAAIKGIKGAAKGAGKGAWGYTKRSAGAPPPEAKTKFGRLLQKANLPMRAARSVVQAVSEVEERQGRGPGSNKPGVFSKVVKEGQEMQSKKILAGSIQDSLVQKYSVTKKGESNLYTKTRGQIKGRLLAAIGAPSDSLLGSTFRGSLKGAGLIKDPDKAKKTMTKKEAQEFMEKHNLTEEEFRTFGFKVEKGGESKAEGEEGPKIISENVEQEFRDRNK